MKSRVQKWGNSLAIRIPKALAAKARLLDNTPVELSLPDGQLVIRPLATEALTLDELLRGVTKENLHGEWDTGAATRGRHAIRVAANHGTLTDRDPAGQSAGAGGNADFVFEFGKGDGTARSKPGRGAVCVGKCRRSSHYRCRATGGH